MKGRWIIAGTPITEPYPCRCGEAKYGKCRPAFCPCAARPDPPAPECCGHRTTPADIVADDRAWRVATGRY